MAILSGKDRQLCDVLVSLGLVRQEEIDRALNAALHKGEPLARYLVRGGMVPEEQMCVAQAHVEKLPRKDLTGIEVPADLGRLFPYTTLREYGCVPIAADDGVMQVAAIERLPRSAIRDLERGSGRRVEQFLAPEEQVYGLLKLLYRGVVPRRFTRYEIRLPVRLGFCTRLGKPIGSEVSALTTLNLSLGGLAVFGMPVIPAEIPEMKPPDVHARIVLQHPGLQVEAVCQLRWARREEGSQTQSHPWLLGMEILDLSGPDQERLMRLCAKAAVKRDE